MRIRLLAIFLWFFASLAALASIIGGLVVAVVLPGSRYARNLLVAHDQAGNALLGGDPDETISSVLGKRSATCTICNWLCRLLNRADPGHCNKSIEPDEGTDSLV
jgi:hypothetical protein